MTLGISRRAAFLLLASLFLAANLVFFLWYRSTGQERKARLETRRAALAIQVEEREKEATTLAKQRDRLSQASATIQEFYGNRIGTRQETLAPIVLELHTLLSKAGITPSQIGYSTRPVANLPLSEMQIAFSFRNEYGQFKQLLASIESDRKWIVVREIGLNRDNEIPGAVQVRMSLATYFTGKAGEEPAKPASLSASKGAR